MALFTPEHWSWPQWTWVVLTLIGIGFAVARDGEPKTGKHSFWATLIGTALIASLYLFGGFFRGMGQ